MMLLSIVLNELALENNAWERFIKFLTGKHSDNQNYHSRINHLSFLSLRVQTFPLIIFLV